MCKTVDFARERPLRQCQKKGCGNEMKLLNAPQKRDPQLRQAKRAVRLDRRKHRLVQASHNWELYVMLLPVLAYFIIFSYMPMYGLQIAFKDFKVSKGIAGSDWAGLKYFIRFLKNPMFKTVLRNTLTLSIYSLVAGFLPPIVLALLLNYQKNLKLKKFVQSLSFAPHFISTVVFVGMIKLFTSESYGVINHLLEMLGMDRINFLASEKIFPHLYVWTGVWQHTGWSAIIYIGALSAVSPELHEAAIADGATLWQRIWHIDLPGILDTILIVTILDCGHILSVGFEKVYLMMNDLNAGAAEVISTYVYSQGLIGGQFSYSTAIGLFNSVVNFILLVIVNQFSKRARDISVF